MTCEPLSLLLKKEVPTVWNEQCQETFEKIKNYLMKPPILVSLVPKKPLLLYLTVKKFGFSSHTKHTTEATNMDLLHS